MYFYVKTIVAFWVGVQLWGLHVTARQGDGDVRLVGGSWPGEGILEVRYNGGWGYVCDDDFSDSGNVNGPKVVCRQLGFPTSHPKAASATVSSTAFYLDDVRCRGTETTISQCSHRSWRTHNCGNTEHVRVTCDNPCKHHPCQHGGTCTVQNTGGYQCRCTSQYEGNVCHTRVNFCKTNNGGCSHLCVNEPSGHHCECPDAELHLSSDNRTCIANGVQVICSSQDMVVEFNKQQFPGLHAQYLHLRDSSCRAQDTPTIISLGVPLDGCGTSKRTIGNAIAFENTITTTSVSASHLVTHVREVNVTIRCLYDIHSIARNFYLVNDKDLLRTQNKQGSYQINMDLIHNGTVYHQSGGLPLIVKPGEKLSVKLSLATNVTNLQVFARNCKATPTSHIDAPVQYFLLKEGCAHDTTLTFENITKLTEETLTLDSFKFLGNESYVYFHCEVLICNVSDPTSRCHQGCVRPGSGKRSIPERGSTDIYLQSETMTAGPITLAGRRTKRAVLGDYSSENRLTGLMSEQTTLFVGVTLIVASVVMAVLAAVIFVKTKSSFRTKQPTPVEPAH